MMRVFWTGPSASRGFFGQAPQPQEGFLTPEPPYCLHAPGIVVVIEDSQEEEEQKGSAKTVSAGFRPSCGQLVSGCKNISVSITDVLVNSDD